MTYEAVHAWPDGSSTVSRFGLAAAATSFEGIVIRNHGDEPASFDPSAVAEAAGIDVVTGVEIRADDPAQASGFLGSHREHHEIVVVHGGNPAINRFAVDQPAVDVLAHPMAGDGSIDSTIASLARDNGVHLEFNFEPVLRSQGGHRVRALADLRKLRELVEAYDVPYVVSADPETHLQLRAPRELCAVGEAIGFRTETIERGLTAWGKLAERNRERLSDSFVAPGVQRVLGEEESDGE